MDIHKPKPWHGWREFLKEIGTIVIGVLIALGAEQVVEWLHWQEKVEQGERQERVELTGLYGVAKERATVEPCLDRRLANLSDALLDGDGAWRPLPPMNVGGDPVAFWAPVRLWGAEVWKTLADGTASHLGGERELLYEHVYVQVTSVAEANAAESGEVQGLGILGRETVLTRPERNQLVAQIERERTRNAYAALSSRQLMAKIEKVTQVDQARVAAFLKSSPVRVACEKLELLK